MKFFAGRGEYPAAGVFSTEHIIWMIACFIIFLVAVCLTKNKRPKNPYRFIQIVSIVIFVLEILKMVWGMSIGRYANIYNYLPLWFCSLFIPFSLLVGFAKGKLQQAALSFLYYGGLVGGIAYLIFPTTSIGRYPAIHFITFHSMFYHTLMVYVAIYVIHNKMIQPRLKDATGYLLLTTAFCVISYGVNNVLNTNYMFLSSPSNNAVLKALYASTGEWYPVALTVLQNGLSFVVGYILYYIIKWGMDLYKNRRSVCRTN